MSVQDVFRICVEAIRSGEFIQRVSSTDKEFHFQNWFKARLEQAGKNFEIGGRNSYPDFRMVAVTDGYELKGLAYPGRDASFDSNSQVPVHRESWGKTENSRFQCETCGSSRRDVRQ